MSEPANSMRRAPARFPVRRWLPFAAIVLASAIVISLGWHRQLSLDMLVRHHASIHAFIQAKWPAAIAVYIAIYVVAVALSLPSGLFLTLTGGLLFGGAVGGSAAIVGATAGATIIFLIARTAFGEILARRGGAAAEKLVEGFRADAFHYLLFLRLVPVFPFFLVNLVPALAGVSLPTFVGATVIGIVPAAFAFAYVGAGLDSVLIAQAAAYDACFAASRADCRLNFDIKTAATPELLAALAALGVVALIPVIVRRLRARRAANLPS